MVNSNYLTQDNNYEVSPRLSSSSSSHLSKTKDTANSTTTTEVFMNNSSLLSTDNMIAVANHQDEQTHADDLDHSGK